MSNWPNNTDLSAPNWTGKPARKSKKYGSYSKPDATIFDELFLVVLVLFAVFGFIPLLYWIMG